jgi:competence protein ComEC
MRWAGWLGMLPMLLIAPQHPLSGDMKVTVLDVGQGLSVVVQTAAHTLLYDAGAKYSAQADAGGRIVLPFLQGEGVRHLDGFVVSHNDTDHSGGMTTVLTQMPVSWLLSSLPQDLALGGNVNRIKCFAGQHWTWDGIKFEVLHPQLDSYVDAAWKDNNRSCVLKVTSASGSLLLTGDIEKSVESALVESQAGKQDSQSLNSDILVAPHHGSKTSSSAGFIAAVQPDLTIFTAGYLNRFRHPRAEVLARYKQAGSRAFRSDYDGAVTLNFVADDKAGVIKAESWRKQNKHYWHDFY